MFARDEMASSYARGVWIASPLFASFVEEKAVADAMAALVSVTVGGGFLVILFATWSFGLALAAAVIQCLALVAAMFGASVMGVRAGAAELVGIAVFAACSAPPLLRVTRRYAWLTLGPGSENGVGSEQIPQRLSLRSVSIHESKKRDPDAVKPTLSFWPSPSDPTDEELVLWPGAPLSERKRRLQVSLIHAQGAVLSGAFAALVSGVSLRMVRPMALQRVGNMLICASVWMPLATLGLLPVLMLLGLGPTRVRGEAFRRYSRYRSAKRRQKKHGADMDSKVLTEGLHAAQVLGFPFSYWTPAPRIEQSERVQVVGTTIGRMGSMPQADQPRVVNLQLNGATQRSGRPVGASPIHARG